MLEKTGLFRGTEDTLGGVLAFELGGPRFFNLG
jgi:hypothetical protein